MSNSNNDTKTIQKLFAEKDKLKQKILDSLTELYFLRNNGLMCDYPVWTSKEQYSSIISNTKDEDLVSDQRFPKLLNLQLFDESPTRSQQQLPPTTPSQQQSTSTPQQPQHPPQSPKTQTDSELQTTTPVTTATTTTHAAIPATTTPTAAVAASTTVSPHVEAAVTPATTTTSSSSTTPATTTTTSLPKAEDVTAAANTTAGGAAPTAATTATTTAPSIPQAETTITTATNTTSIAINTITATSSAPALTNDTVSSSGKDSAKRKRSFSQERDSESQASTIISKNDDGISPPPEKKICDESLRLESDISAKQPTDLLGPQNQSSQQQQQTNSTNSCIQDVDADKLVRDRKPRASPSKDESMKVIEIDVSDDVGRKQHGPSITANSVISRTESLTPVATAPTQYERIAERARHEAAVTERIAELRKQGLWSARRLPKLQDPPRPKTHWDYLLEEMRWLSTDFESERKWKRKTAKKCAYMVYRYHQEKRLKEERQEKEKLQSIKRIAASQAKEIRSFWQSIEKIVDFRQQTKLEETRKKAWGLHLNYILDQTSKFSNTFLEDTKPTITKEENIDYPNNPEGEKTEKEPVINNEEQNKSKHKVDDMAAGAESIQPKGYTLETATVSTKVPFLLKHQLREYQHIGLDWLVAMYKKQLNGILADEMGLGKTIQTIALLAHLACEEQDWGPHLIVVPTSVMLNWEMEFKKWCPAFKILTYYGNPKERKMKRVGWSRPNSFHVCITSYRIVIQDHAAFRRKQWSYLILDEAHYIKNFKSQRWQMLLNFNSQRRLLLTGTPLQNDLMELWSLMHFLMPSLFDSYREFKDWFVNPLTGMIEGSHEYNQELVNRLHKILRPFLLRRLKADVEKQLPSKKEIIKYCRLSKRQRFLYEEFMSLSKTKETLASGNFLSVINVLMQLRKVCNHPNLFEPRPTISPFMMKCIAYEVPGLLTTPLDYNPDNDINLEDLQLLLANNSVAFSSSARHFIQSRRCTHDQILREANIDTSSDASSQATETESVQEVDEAMLAINNSKIAEAYGCVKEARRREKLDRLKSVSKVNDIRCGKINALYINDLQECLDLNNLKNLNNSSSVNIFSAGNARILCSAMDEVRSKPKYRIQHLSSLLDESVRSPEQVCEQMSDIIRRYVFCVPGASAPPVSMHVSHHSPSKKTRESFMQKALYEDLSPRSDFLHKIVVNMRTCFPELRLIEYDCGKLQALSRLLTELKSNDHRVLIFTQMSRMLDILEQFLNYHGHTYLRLDGATRIDQRQILMERFNNDKRIFCFILSTRSGGIGVNLTGADTVIFYDSDWNPTMDAQAQDRCHRIGQTRDVHIYRLISEDTIEQNIYRKAQQKRMLGDLAIEEGNFGTSCFKKSSIQELFEATKAPADEVETVIEMDDQPSEMTNAQLSKLEQALSKGEAEAGEDMDVDAIKVARADVDTDLREFDENIPLTEESSPVEKSEKEQQIDTIVSQMTPVEQYAVRFLESLQKPKNKEELEQAEREYRQELENKKSQWEQSRIEMLKEQSTKNDLNGTLLTYPKGAKCEHVQFLLDGERKLEEMPIWAPPTPPTSPPSPVEESNQHHYQPAMTPAMAARISAMGGLGNIFGFGSDSHRGDNRHYINEKDVYVDYTLHFLYEPNVMPESQLPAVNQHYTDSEATSYTIGSKKIRLTGTPVVPGGYFQTSSQMPLLQQHLRNLTNVPTTPDGSGSGLIGQQAPRKPKVRRDEVICLPKSIFDRITPNFAKIRRELKLQKLRCVTKGNDSDPFAMQKFFHSFSLNPLGQSLQQENIITTVNRQMQYNHSPSFLLGYYQERLPPWSLQEEWALIMVIQHLQDLPVNLCVLTPGHTPNWELVSEVVSDIGFTYRSFKMCEYHFAMNVQKREMTRNSSWEERALPSTQSESLPSPSKKSKKQKTMSGSQSTSGADGQSSQSTASSIKNSTPVPFKASKTGAMLAHDKSLQFSFKERYELIKQIHANRPKPVITRCSSKERPSNNPTLFRDDKRLIDYDRPLRPEVIVMERRPQPRPSAATHPGHMMPQQPQCGCCLPSTGTSTTSR